MLTERDISTLHRRRTAALATVDAAGRPHIVPVCFAVVEGRIAISLDEKPKRVPPERLQRVRNIERNPAVCLMIDDYDEDWSRLAWLQVHGRATILVPGDDGGDADAVWRISAIAVLRQRYPPYRAMALESRPLLCIHPERVVRWSASPPDA